jgi:hypothetical protein
MSLLPASSLGIFGGMRVIISEHATEEFRIFPDKPRTKRRMRRLRGKWGNETRRRPCAFQTPQGLIVHPAIAAKLKDAKP